MEGRSVVLRASYWIGAGAMSVLPRQIRVAIARVESEGATTVKPIWGARFQEKLLRLYA